VISSCVWRIAPYGAGGVASGAGIDGYLRVRVRAVNAQGVPTEWEPRALPGGELEWLVPLPSGGRVEASRGGIPIFKQYCPIVTEDEPCQPPLWAYELQAVGLAGVRVEGVQPLQVLPPSGLQTRGDTALVPVGEATEFRVQVIDGITDVTWFVYGDGGAQIVGRCNGAQTCRVVARRPGLNFVHVYGRYNGFWHEARLYGVRATESTLVLECTAPDGTKMRAPGTLQLERTATISCAAFADPAAELTNVRWSFSGQGFTYPETSEGDPPIDTPGWGGTIVMSGTISVQAEINGAEQRKQLSVDVQPRAGFKAKEVQVSIRRGTLADVPEDERPNDPPTNVTDLGRAMSTASLLGYNPREDLAEVLRTIGMIQDEGPNHGLAYLKEVPMQPSAIVVIHPALNRGSAFYGAQAQTSNVVSGTQPCVQSRWDTYVRLVEEHEGLNGNANSHVGAFQAALNPAAAEAVEHVVGRMNNLAAMAQEWTQLLRPVAANAFRQSSNEVFHQRPGGRVPFGCEFNFNVRRR
jgi:hypothetical protein